MKQILRKDMDAGWVRIPELRQRIGTLREMIEEIEEEIQVITDEGR